MPIEAYWSTFIALLVVPFDNLGVVWGILPVYAVLVLGEVYGGKFNFNLVIVNGLVILWAGLDWAWRLSNASSWAYIFSSMKVPWVVTAICIGLGVFTVVLGVRRQDKHLCQILARTRYTCYFLVLLYPMQARLVEWSGAAMASILVFAVPSWLLIYLFGRLGAKVVK